MRDKKLAMCDIDDRSESCINNVKLTLNCTKDYERSPHRNHKHHQKVDSSTYTRQTKDKRSRTNEKHYRASLENVSTNVWKDGFDEQSSLRRTRSLAISRENLFYSLDYVSTEVQGQSRRRRSQLIPRARLIDRNKDYRYSVENLYSPPRRSRRPSDLAPPDYTPPEETYIERYHQHHQTVEETYSFPRKLQKTDSLDSNSNNKSSKNGVQASYEELSLPNYYPEARYDTDNTDNISLTDNISSLSLDNLSKFKYSSFDNLDIKWDRLEQTDSIPYDENIVLSTNRSLYEEVKPKTIRNPTDYREDTHSKPSSDPSLDIKEVEETDTNHDEINLNNDSVEKEETSDDISTVVEVASDKADTIKTIKAEAEESKEQSVISEEQDNPIKTYIEVTEAPQEDDKYKTVVAVDISPEKQIDIPNKCKHVNRKDPKSHSHNYLKEFLETQKGSKKPLQNFIAKKFSHLSRRQSKEGGNLVENQFHSLPDISISKNLRKCEKIDRKLRKCEKSEHIQKHKEAFGENRFIVNIGRHFDITANSSIPLDFELKIAKIPKKVKKTTTKAKGDQEFLEAVKSLKATLQNSTLNLDENHNITKDMDILNTDDRDTKEFKEKLGSMRTYWCKMTGSNAPQSNGEASNEDDKKNDGCKIVEVQTKVDEVKKKFEKKQEQPEEKPPSKVQLTKQLFEPKPVQEKTDKISPLIKESCNYFENNAHLFDTEKPYESLCPANVEIVEAKTNGVYSTTKDTKKDETDNKKNKITKSTSINQPEFDHVRYKIVKSDLFQKKIFANCEKESQFDGLIEYLQNYSFQELLIDNNIVIIEPIRSKVPYEPSECVKSMRNVTPMLHKSKSETQDTEKSTLNKHFFYRPIRVNKEVNDDELPNPDTVRQVREFFEGGLKKSLSNQDVVDDKEKQSENTSDPDKDRCSATDTNSHPSNISDFDGQENLYDSIDNEIYCEYVSEDILEKIRECGSTVTYYGGRVVKQNSSQPLLTKAIMEEIQNNEKRCNECKNCIRNSCDDNQESFMGMKFRILKSNSCSSRLELVGTESLQESRRKMMFQHRKTMNQGNLRRKSNVINEDTADVTNDRSINMDDKNAINEHIKKQNQSQPKIIGEEMKVQENKVTQWKEIKKDGSCNNVNFNEKKTQKIFDYYHYDKVKTKSKKMDDMEFEPYEVAG
nr:unnamed protein product [Callosobruchus chinensis]